MTPLCCKKCEYLTPCGNCRSNSTDCQKWREWFHEEWTGIQKVAQVIKERKNADDHIGKRSTVCIYKEREG